MNIRPTRIALIFFAVALLALIALADSGHGRWLFRLASTVPGGDKLGHCLLFGTLSFLVNLSGQGRTVQVGGFRLLQGSTLVMSFATLEECSQLLFRSRSFDLLDLVSNAVGIWLFGRLAVVCLARKTAPARAIINSEAKRLRLPLP